MDINKFEDEGERQHACVFVTRVFLPKVREYIFTFL